MNVIHQIHYLLYYYYTLIYILCYKLNDQQDKYEPISNNIITNFTKLYGKYYLLKYETILIDYFMDMQSMFINMDYDSLDSLEINRAKVVLIDRLYNSFLEPIQITLFENIINDIFSNIRNDDYLTEEQLRNIFNSYSTNKLYIKFKKLNKEM